MTLKEHVAKLRNDPTVIASAQLLAETVVIDETEVCMRDMEQKKIYALDWKQLAMDAYALSIHRIALMVAVSSSIDIEKDDRIAALKLENAELLKRLLPAGMGKEI